MNDKTDFVCRVEVWAFVFSVAHPFVCECHNIPALLDFQSPPPQTVLTVLPYTAFLLNSSINLINIMLFKFKIYSLPQVL